MRFSIIIPTYNREKQIERALNSVIQQNFPDWEIVVVDDDSTDQTAKVIKKYLKQYPNKIRYFYKIDGGVGSARNYGIHKARGDYFVFLDGDDELVEGALFTLDGIIKKFSKNKIFFLGIQTGLGKRMYYLKKDFLLVNFEKFVEGEDIFGEFLSCVRVDLFQKEGYYFPESVNGGELLMWLEMLKKHKIIAVAEDLRVYHLDAENPLVRELFNEERVKNVLRINKLVIEKFGKDYEVYNKKTIGKNVFCHSLSTSFIEIEKLGQF